MQRDASRQVWYCTLRQVTFGTYTCKVPLQMQLTVSTHDDKIFTIEVS